MTRSLRVKVRTYVLRRGCTLAAPFAPPVPAFFSLTVDFSSPEPESDVEKWREDGARTLPGVVGRFCACASAGWPAAELLFELARKRDCEWLEK